MFPFLSVTNITKLERLHRAASRAITGCLSSSRIPLFFSETSLPQLRVTLTRFTLSLFKWAIRLPTSYPISGLAKLEVKPRLQIFLESLCVYHPLMLPSTSPREALLSCSPSPPCNMSSFTVESTLSFLRSRSDPPSLTKMRLSLILTLSHLTIWYSGLTALFIFL